MAVIDNINGQLLKYKNAPSGYVLTSQDAVALLQLIKDTYEKEPFPLQQVLQSGSTMEEISILVGTGASVTFDGFDLKNIEEGGSTPISQNTTLIFTSQNGSSYVVNAQEI